MSTMRRSIRGATDRGDDGNVTVEFAILGVLFFMLVGVAIQGAILFNSWLSLSNAVEEGARYGVPCYGRTVSSCSIADITTAVNQAAPLDTSKLTVIVTSANGLLSVSASYNVPLVAPFVSALLPDPTTVVAVSSMRLENGGS